MIDPRHPTRVAGVFACAAAAALSAATIGFGATTTVTDGNDTKGPIDIASASATKTKSGMRKHVVTFFAKVPPKGQTGNEILELWKKKPHHLKGAPPGVFKEGPYKIMGPQTGKRDVFTGGEAGTPFKKTGTATVTRSGKKLTFVFSLKAIGNPTGSYYWHVKSDYYGPAGTCPTGPCEDHAPNGDGTVKQAV
jgi:hypothetical protein